MASSGSASDQRRLFKIQVTELFARIVAAEQRKPSWPSPKARSLFYYGLCPLWQRELWLYLKYGARVTNEQAGQMIWDVICQALRELQSRPAGVLFHIWLLRFATERVSRRHLYHFVQEIDPLVGHLSALSKPPLSSITPQHKRTLYALAKLPWRQSACLILFDHLHCETIEISQILEIPEAEVVVHMKLGRDNFLRLLPPLN